MIRVWLNQTQIVNGAILLPQINLLIFGPRSWKQSCARASIVMMYASLKRNNFNKIVVKNTVLNDNIMLAIF